MTLEAHHNMANSVRRSFATIWAFPQLRHLFLLVLAIIVAVPALAVFWAVPAFTALLVANSQEEIVRDTSLLAGELVRLVGPPTRAGLAAAGAATRLLDDAATRLGGEKIRLFSRAGEILYSSDPGEVGAVHGGAIFSNLLGHGKPYSRIEHPGSRTAEGQPVTRAIIESYVPIMAQGDYAGAFEVYVDVTRREAMQASLLRRIGLLLAAFGALLSGFLVYMLHQAGRTLMLKALAEASLRETAIVFEASSDAIFITDGAGTIRRTNPAFTEITGYTAEDAVGRTPRILKSGRHDATFYERFWRALNEDGHWEGEVLNRRKDGTVYPQWEAVTTLKGPDGETVGYLSQFSDVARRKLTEAEVRYRANYDALTGLANRTLLVERLERAILEAERDDRRVAVMFVDLDHFKEINDTLGHLAGDMLLQDAAQALKGCVRTTDTVARQGGDEFVVLLPGIDTIGHAVETADRIVQRFRLGISSQELASHITASVGVAIYPDDGGDPYTLFRNADLAMYRSKDQGRDNVQFYESEMTELALGRRHLENDLRNALAGGQMSMHYQPIVDLASGRPVGVEALMRWRHPERGMVAPDQFIPLAESTGLIRDLGAWALATVAAQVGAWRRDGLTLYAAVNISGRQVPDSVTPEGLAQLVREHGIAASDLLLEITEGVLLRDIAKSQAWVNAVRAIGFRVALDDFGTGYSSLSYLKRLDLDVVKIDKSFVTDMDSNGNDLALVQTIVGLGKTLGLKVVAEGVESDAQRALLRQLGCDLVQGYGIGRPMPADALAPWWAAYRADGAGP